MTSNLPLIGLSPFDFTSPIDQTLLENNDIVVYCRECMTFISHYFTQKDIEYICQHPFDVNSEKVTIAELKAKLAAKKNHPDAWEKLGYALVLHIDWCMSLLEELPGLQATEDRYKLYVLVYYRIRDKFDELFSL
jgi:hypothetical protein